MYVAIGADQLKKSINALIIYNAAIMVGSII